MTDRPINDFVQPVPTEEEMFNMDAELDAITDDEWEASDQWLRDLVTDAIERHHLYADPEWIADVVLDELFPSMGVKEVPDGLRTACRGSVLRVAREVLGLART